MTAAGAAGQIDLGDIAGHHDLGSETQPGEEHLHLLSSGVLRLVENDERVIETAAAHICQRRDLDHARSHKLRNRFDIHHVVQGVVERTQIRVDLFAQRPGQKTKALTGFHRRAGQDDSRDLLGLQSVDRLGHGQVGLAGAGRTDAENDGVGIDGVDVALLVERLGPDRLAAPGENIQTQHLCGRGAIGSGDHGDTAAHRIRRQRLTAGNDGDEFGDHLFRQCHIGGRTGEVDGVTAHVNFGRQAGFKCAKIPVC